MHFRAFTALSTIAIIGFGSAGLTHAANNANTMTNQTTAKQTAVSDANDGSAISLTGTVGEIRADEFDLNYGTNNKVIVELDRFGWSSDATQYLTQGESVTISGYIDDDLFEGREIEAYNVRLNDNNIYYYTSSANPSYTYSYDRRANQEAQTASSSVEDGSYLNMTGRVSEISGSEFQLTNASGTMQVDASELGYDPFDDEGMQQIKNGDRVYVYGSMDKGFFESNEIVATGLVELVDSSRTN